MKTIRFHVPACMTILFALTAGIASGDPIQNARTAFGNGEYAQVDTILHSALERLNPPVPVLELSLEANIAQGNFVTANRRIDTLLRITENRDLDLVYQGADLAALIGDATRERERLRFYAMHQAQRNERLDQAFKRLLGTGMYPDVYRRYVELHGATDPAWTYGMGLLNRFIRAFDGAQVRGHAEFLMNTFDDPERVNAVVARLRHAADDHILGRGDERYRQALEAIVGNPFTDQGQVNHLINQIPGPQRLDLMLRLQASCPQPFDEYLFNHFNPMHDVDRQDDRVAMGRTFLEFEPLYRQHDDPSHYLRYVNFISHRPQVFRVENQVLVPSARMQQMFATLHEAFADTPARLHDLSQRVLDNFVTDEAERAALIRQHAPAINHHRLHMAMGPGYENAAEIVRLAGNSIGVRHHYLRHLEDPELKEEILNTVRDWVMAHPAHFDGADLGRKLRDNPVPSIAEKVAVLRDLYAKIGYTEQMKRLVDEMNNNNEIRDDEQFTEFKREFEEWNQGNDALALAQIGFWEKNFGADDPQLPAAVEQAFEVYGGIYPLGQDWRRDRIMRSILDRYRGIAWNNREAVYTWAETMAPHLGRTDYWDDTIRRVREHGGGDRLLKVAEPYLAAVDAGWEGRPGVWSELRNAVVPPESQTAALSDYYARLSRGAAHDFLSRNRDRFTQQAFVNEADKILQAHPLEGWREDQARNLLNDLHHRTRHHSSAEAEPTRLVADQYWDYYIGNHAGDRGERNRTFEMTVKLDGIDAAVAKHLDYSRSQPPVQRAVLASELVEFALGRMPREDNNAELQPGHRGHLILKTLKPVFEAVPAGAENDVWVHDWVLGELEHLSRHGSDEAKALTEEMQKTMGHMLANGMRFWGHRHHEYRAVHPIVQNALEEQDWRLAMDGARHLGRRFHESLNWGHIDHHHIAPLAALMSDKEAWEILYVFTSQALEQEPERNLEARLINLKAQAARHIGGLFPVSQDHPQFDLFQAADDFNTGNLGRAWELTRPKLRLLAENWLQFDKMYVAWVVEQMRLQNMYDEARELTNTMLLQEEQLMPEAAASILLTRADIHRDTTNYEAARVEYQALQGNRRYAHTDAARQAGFRLVDLLIRTGAYESAHAILERWSIHSQPEMRAQGHFFQALIAFERQEYATAREELGRVFDIDFGHVEGRLLEGEIKALTGVGVGEPEIPVGTKGERDYIVPGRQLVISITDRNLAVVRQGQSIPVLVTTSEGGDRERVSLFPSSGSPHKFRAVVSTTLGNPVPGDMQLQLRGGDVIRYEIDPQFITNNDLDPLPAKELSVVDDARLYASAGRILTDEEQQQLALEAQIAETRSQSMRDFGRTGMTVRPGNEIYIQVIDADRSVSPQRDSVFVDARTSSGDVVERFELTEIEPWTGVFRGTLDTAIPPPRAAASDSAQGSDPSLLINTTKGGLWQSGSAEQGEEKWVEVDTMSSHDVAKLTLDLPDPEAVTGVAVQGTLTGDFYTLGSYPADESSAEGGVMLQVVRDRHQEHHVGNMRSITIRAGEESGPFTDPAFNRENTPFQGRNGWMIGRVRGNFYIPESKTYEFRFIHDPSPHNWQYAYMAINGREVLGGLINENTIRETGTVVLSAGVHQYELLVRDHWQNSRAEVGFRQDDGTYAPLPAEWFSTEASPELADALRERATVARTDTGFAATFDEPERLRRVRWVFKDFSGNTVQAREMALVNTDGETVIPSEVDFTSAMTNRILEIAPGDSIDITYHDEIRTRPENAVLNASLNAGFHNGTIRIASESVRQTRDGMESVYHDAIRFRPGDQLTILVEDYDKDVSSDADTVAVTIETSRGETLTMQALERRDERRPAAEGIHTGLFYAVLRTGDATQGNMIKVVPGDHIEVSYMDRENTDPGIPVRRTAKVVEAGTSQPDLIVYRTSVEQVEDTSPTAQRHLDRMRLRGTDTDGLKIYTDEMVAMDPDLLPDDQKELLPVRASMNVPLLFQVFYPSMALNSNSTVTATLVTEAEAEAARREARQPVGTDVPLRIDRLAAKARNKGYDVRVESTARHTDEQLLTRGVFSAVVRLQIGAPDDPIDDIVRTGDPAAAVMDAAEVERVATLLISEPQTLRILLRDADGEVISETPVKLASDGRIELLDSTYSVSKSAIHAGERFYVRVTDPDQSVSPEQDQVTVSARSTKTGDTLAVALTETMPYSGVFTASIRPVLRQQAEQANRETGGADADAQDAPADGAGQLLIEFGDTVVFEYRDPVTLAGTPRTVTEEGTVHLGADGRLSVFTKRYRDSEMAVKVRFLRAEALFEMAKDYRRLDDTERSEQLIADGRRILTEALRDYPNTDLISQGQYLLANLSQELAEDHEDPERQRELYQEAIGRYSSILSSWPDSDYAPQALFRLAICFERLGDYSRATEEYVKLTYTYPEHRLVPDATVRLGNHYYRGERYDVAAEIFYNFQQRFQDHALADRALFLAAQCHMKKAQVLEQSEREHAARGDHLRQAVTYLTQLMDTYRDNNDLRAEAMYWIGDNQFKLRNFRQSYIAFKKLTFDYPASEWARRARGYLTDQAFARIEE